MYSQKQCMQMISEWETARGFTYERVIYSRPDFQWTAQHIPLAFLSSPHIWIMDGEAGLNCARIKVPSLPRHVLSLPEFMHCFTVLGMFFSFQFFGSVYFCRVSAKNTVFCYHTKSRDDCIATFLGLRPH